MAGLRCGIYLPTYHAPRDAEMVASAPNSALPGFRGGRRRLPTGRVATLYDANPGGANTVIQLRAYGEIAYEIYDELRDAPAVVAVPVSNGTTLAGIHHGFVSLYRRGKTSRIRLGGRSSHGKNPIVMAGRRTRRLRRPPPRRSTNRR